MHQNFFITGGASGIGLQMTEALILDGHHVFATDIDITKLEDEFEHRAWPTARVAIQKLDVSKDSEWQEALSKAISRFEHIDVGLNIAGVMRARWIHETPVEDIHSQIDINLKGVILGTRCLSGHMINRKKGHIVNIASMTGLLPVPGMSIYSCSKYGVIGFSKSAARELRPHGVFVTVVCPDAVKTPLFNFPRRYNEEAAMAFAGPGFLSVEHVCRTIIDSVFKNKPEMLCIPKYRGLLAKVGEFFPAITRRALPLMIKRGRNAQKRYKTGKLL